ncbi:CD82 antigen-like [Apostichopus japonicus]|uniref:CD82 antigen-like n=1 Tax=Stichopus japonicus TaxID=307972 RepID=UPI003AB75AB5
MKKCVQLSRIFLVFWNCLLFLTGIFLTLVAMFVLYSPGTISSFDQTDKNAEFNVIFNSTYVIAFAWACAALGVFITVISLCGCLGSCILNRAFLSVYLFAMVLITLLHIAFGIIIVFSPELFKSPLNTTFKNQLNGDDFYQGAWASLQITVECCGVNGTIDYKELPSDAFPLRTPCCAVKDGLKTEALQNYISKESDNNVFVNLGRCEQQFDGTAEGSVNATVWNDIGCIDKIYGDITLFGTALLALLVIEVFIIISGCILCCQRTEKPI